MKNGRLVERCGDGIRVGAGQECDDGNKMSGDGCNEVCVVERGWKCEGGSRITSDWCEMLPQPAINKTELNPTNTLLTIQFNETLTFNP